MKANRIVSALALSAILATGMIGCKKTAVPTSSTPVSSAPVSSSVVPASSSSSTDDTAVTLKGVTTVEIGYDVTIKATVQTSADEKGVNFSISDPNVASITPALASVKVSGLNPGTATITAASKANPAAKATIEITVIKPLPVVMHAIYNLTQKTNYTVTASKVDGDAKTVETIDKVTPKAITVTDKDGAAKLVGATSGISYLGEAVDTEGFAFDIEKDTAGALTAGKRIKSNTGFLTDKDFLGTGLNSESPNSYGTFYGIQALNPNWFSDEKNRENVYTVEGPTADEVTGDTATNAQYNAAYAECMIWNILDPVSFNKGVASLDTKTYANIATLVKTSVEVKDAEDVVFTTEVAAIGDAAAFTLEGVISDVGTTEIAADISTYIATVKAEFPALSADLKAAKTAIAGNDYLQVNTYYAGGKVADDFTVYYAKDYQFTYYDPVFTAKWKANAGKAWAYASSGVVRKADGIYEFTYTEAVKDDSGAITTPAAITLGDKIDGTDATSTVPATQGYLSTTDTWNDTKSYVNYLTDNAAKLWQSSSLTYHYTYNVDVFTDMYKYYTQENPDAAVTVLAGVNATLKADGTADKVSMTLGYSPSGSGFYTMNYAVSGFGTATTAEANPIKTLIADYIGK
jgi:hypothetical protein